MRYVDNDPQRLAVAGGISRSGLRPLAGSWSEGPRRNADKEQTANLVRFTDFDGLSAIDGYR